MIFYNWTWSKDDEINRTWNWQILYIKSAEYPCYYLNGNGMLNPCHDITIRKDRMPMFILTDIGI